MGDLIKVQTYDGSHASALQALIDLKIEDDYYHYDLRTGKLVLIKFGLVLRPGDCYQYRLPPQPIEAIG
jgi:hypothetical protein